MSIPQAPIERAKGKDDMQLTPRSYAADADLQGRNRFACMQNSEIEMRIVCCENLLWYLGSLVSHWRSDEVEDVDKVDFANYLQVEISKLP